MGNEGEWRHGRDHSHSHGRFNGVGIDVSVQAPFGERSARDCGRSRMWEEDVQTSGVTSEYNFFLGTDSNELV